MVTKQRTNQHKRNQAIILKYKRLPLFLHPAITDTTTTTTDTTTTDTTTGTRCKRYTYYITEGAVDVVSCFNGFVTAIVGTRKYSP